MATKGVEMQTIECPVCFENYNEPKILPCAHLLCRRCLVSLMTKKRDALCPLCSSAIVDPQDFTSKSCEDLIDSLPTDHAMSAMVESVKVLSEKHVCHAHRSVATSLCLQCSVKLCQSCVEGHKILPVTSSHKLEDLSTLTLEVLTASRQEPCSEHPDKISELFCTFHNVLICHLCAASQHRACPEVTGLNEMYDKYKQSLSDLKSKLNITMSSLVQAITRIEEHLVQTEKNMKVTFTEIDKTCDSLVNSVETCRKRLKKLVQDADDKIKVTALDQKSSLGERRGRITSHINLIHRVQQMAHGSSLVAMVPKLESLIAKLYLDTALPEEAGQGLKMVTLTIDPNASLRVKSELDKIGNVMVSSTTIQDERVTRTQLQDSPNSNLTFHCRVSIPNELLQGSDPEACLKNILLKSPDVRISKTEHNIIFLVRYDCLVKLATTIQEQITNTVVRLEDNSQNQITHRASTTEINSLEFEAMQHLLSHDFFQHFSKVKEDGEKVIITSDSQETMEKFKEMYNSIRQEKVKLAQDEVSCLEKSADFLSEDVEAFIKLLPLESKVVIICFDYNAMTKAKHLINVKLGKVKRTQRNKRKFEGGAKESDEMIDHQTSLTAVSYIDSNSGHSYVKHKDFTTKSGIKVSVYKFDITQLTVDVIVNAANRDLKHDGGVAYAIARAAGPRLELEGDDYVKANGQLKVTEVVPTTAGNLPCRKVLHAVGPRWDDYQNKEQCQHDLEQTVFTCLEKAHDLRFSSIALSTISSAIFGVPKEICAQMYLAAVQRFEQQLGSTTTLQHIHFVDINDKMVGIIQDTFTSLWNTLVLPSCIQPSVSDIRSPVLGSSSVLPHSSVAGEEQHKINKSNFHIPEGSNLGGVQPKSGVRDILLPANSKTFITLSGINVSIYKADITKLAVDIIVSAANKSLMGGAGVSRAIEIAAGPTLSEEKWKYLRENGCLEVTNVVMTTAGKLPCKKVLHAVGPGKYVLKKSVFQDLLVQTIFDCLKKAQDLHDISIAFSSISAALSDAPKEVCARMYLEAVKKFEKEYGGSSHVRYIHFVDIDHVMVGTIQETFQRHWDIPVTQDDSRQSANDMKGLYIDQRWSSATQPLCTDTQLSTESFPLFLDLNTNRTEKRELCYLVEFRNLKLFIKQGDVNDVYSGAVVFWQTSLTTLLDQPVKNYVKTIGERYPTEEIQRLKRGYTGVSTVGTIKMSSDLTLIFSVNPSDMTSARVEERIRDIFKTVSNSNVKLSIPFPLGIKAAGAKLEQFAVGVYTAVEIYAKNLDKSLTEVNVIDTDEKCIRMMAEIIAHKMAQDKSLTVPQKQKASSHTAGAENILAADDKTNNDLRHFPCGHGFCTQGFADSFQQNSVCLICSNKHQLKGTMRMRYSSSRLRGFEGVDSFVITYDIPSGTLMMHNIFVKWNPRTLPDDSSYVNGFANVDDYPMKNKSRQLITYSSVSQKAFLPNTEDGRKVLMLLKVAWDRGLTFTFIESGTCLSVVWNGIEHKTRRGGGCSDGYPDHDYLNRVQQTLTSRGVTEKELSDIQKDFISHPEHFLKSYNTTTDFSYFFN